MPKAAFFQLADTKQARILAAAQQIFAESPYDLASTNALVKTCQISKGSLFNYFEDKADVYIYVLQQAHLDLARAFRQRPDFSPDLLTRFGQWVHLSMNVWRDHPQSYALFLNFAQAPAALQTRYSEENTAALIDFFRSAFADVDTHTLQHPLQDCLDLLEWSLAGIKQSAYQQWQSGSDPEALGTAVKAKTEGLCRMLRSGLYIDQT